MDSREKTTVLAFYLNSLGGVLFVLIRWKMKHRSRKYGGKQVGLASFDVLWGLHGL